MSWIRRFPTPQPKKSSEPGSSTPLPNPIPIPSPPPAPLPVPTARAILQDYSEIMNSSNLFNNSVQPSIRDENGQYLIVDYFIRRNILYLISTFTAKGTPKITLTIDGTAPTEVAYDEGEPARYFYIPIGDKKQFTCRINGKSYTLRPEVVDGRNRVNRFAIATLFKYETPAEIERFLAHYRIQGADKFYFYYNGPTIPENLPTGADIFYKTWDFPYWNQTQYIHLAQMTFLTSYRLRYHEANEWSALVDLDEYMLPGDGNTTLKKFLETTDQHLYRLESRWGAFSEDSSEIRFNPQAEPRMQKYIYKHFFKGLFGIHGPKLYRSEDYLEGKKDELFVVHIANMANKDRTSNLTEPQYIYIVPSL
jgi:hypothetical protein